MFFARFESMSRFFCSLRPQALLVARTAGPNSEELGDDRVVHIEPGGCRIESRAADGSEEPSTWRDPQTTARMTSEPPPLTVGDPRTAFDTRRREVTREPLLCPVRPAPSRPEGRKSAESRRTRAPLEPLGLRDLLSAVRRLPTPSPARVTAPHDTSFVPVEPIVSEETINPARS